MNYYATVFTPPKHILIKFPKANPIELFITPRTLEQELKFFQGISRGPVHTVAIFGQILCICHENGRAAGLQPNFKIGFTQIYGPAAFVAFRGGEHFSSLNSKELEYLYTMIKEI